jgi:hypothetical protein
VCVCVCVCVRVCACACVPPACRDSDATPFAANLVAEVLTRSLHGGGGAAGDRAAEEALAVEALAVLSALLTCMNTAQFLACNVMAPLLDAVVRALQPAAADADKRSGLLALGVVVEVVRRRFIPPSDKARVLDLGMRVFSILKVVRCVCAVLCV